MNTNQLPAAVSLAGNEVLFKATGTNMFSAIGRQSRLTLAFQTGQSIEEDDYLIIEWGGHLIHIVFKPSPVAASSQFVTGTINAAWLTAFAAFLLSHYQFDKDFFQYPPTTVDPMNFYSREKGSEYSLTTDTNLTAAKLIITKQTGITQAVRPGYQLVCQVRHHPTGNILGEDAITPDIQQKATFDVSEYLWVHLKNARSGLENFKFPGGSANILQHTTHTLLYYLSYAEKFDGQVLPLTSTSTFRALMGGLSKLKLQEFALQNKTFYTHLVSDMPFLTWQPVTKATGPKTVERLYFYNRISRALVLKAKKYYADGTTETVDMATLSAAVGVISADVSFQNFLNVAQEIEKYDVWLEIVAGESTEKVSEERTYVVDYRHYRNQNHLVFLNSLGGYDTLRCTGQIVRVPEIERETFEDENRLRRALLNLQDTNFTLNTGSVSAASAHWIDDLLLSQEVFWISNNRLIPVIVNNKKKNAVAGDQLRFSFDIEFTLAGIERFYSTTQPITASTPGIE